MCLSIAIDRPNDVLSKGEHAGHEWITVHNGTGYRCGYVRVPLGHPWHGKDCDDVDAKVHGGLTFAAPDKACEGERPDDAWWLGFDCQHGGDAPDPSLSSEFGSYRAKGDTVKNQAYVEQECRRLCEQAHAAVDRAAT